MSNTRRIENSSDAMAMTMKRDLMPATGAYDTVKSTPSSMDGPKAHVLE